MKNIYLFILGTSFILVGWLTASYTVETKSSTRANTSASASNQTSSPLTVKEKGRDSENAPIHTAANPIAQTE